MEFTSTAPLLFMRIIIADVPAFVNRFLKFFFEILLTAEKFWCILFCVEQRRSSDNAVPDYIVGQHYVMDAFII